MTNNPAGSGREVRGPERGRGEGEESIKLQLAEDGKMLSYARKKNLQ
jgi:hypothetical protein